jgi:outer membrane protein assembly factor BamB/tetratricopeptide (TPR) repeat protein
VLLSLTLLLAPGLAQAVAQAPNRSASKFYPDSSDPAETLLRNAANLAANRQWSEAVGIFQRVIDQYGDKVVRLPKEKVGEDPGEDFVLFVDLRDFCHRSLAKLPPEARTIYRNRMDSLAARWYQEGLSLREPTALRRVVDQAFCSSWGDDAAELLADLAFREGRFGEALAMYRRLVLDRPDDSFGLVHPDPSVDLARVAAKKLLTRAAVGEHLAVGSELEAFKKRFPGASGALAGRKGEYASILAQALVADHLNPPAQPDTRWPTFAGSFSRTHVVSEPIDVGSLQWKVALERITQNRTYPYAPRTVTMTASPSAQDRLLGYHPIVLGDQVVVCDGTRVLAYNLNDRPGGREGSGAAVEPAWKFDPENTGPQAFRGNPGIPRYTLTAVGTRIYARMGSLAPSYFGMGRQGGTSSSYILALDWSAQGKMLWMQKAAELSLPNRPADRVSRTVNFEGTPVADSRNVFVAVTDRRELTATYIVCFDAETGARRWVRYLGAASSDVDNFMPMGMGLGGPVPGDFGHRLLTLDGPYLYFQTNLGAVVSLEAESGAVRWVANYPRQDSNRGGGDRDLNPAIVHDGLVLVAPVDATSIYAFDAQSGLLVWKSDPVADEVKLSHLLGVARGKLVATGDRVLLFDVKNGKLSASWPDSGKFEGYGRGLLAGNRIYWPTRDKIEVLDQSSGLRAEPPIKLSEIYRSSGGNLVAGDGYLIVAQSDALVVFCQNSRLIERYRDEIAGNPEPAAPYYRLARAAEAVGRVPLALESYEQAARTAKPAETIDGVVLAAAARGHQFRLLTRVAEEARRERKFPVALESMEAAAGIASSDADRLRARLLLADIKIEADRPGQAVDLLEELLADGRLRELTVSSDDGHRGIRAELLIADRLTGIVKQRGRNVYLAHERRARELFERGRRDQDPRLLDEVSRVFPIAEVVPAALLALGQIHQTEKRPAAAALAYKRLLTLPTALDEARAVALWRLAQVYESQNYLLAARDSYLQIQARYARLRLPELSPDAPIGDLVAAELGRSALAQVAADGPRAALGLPLVRRWQFQPQGDVKTKLLTASGIPPGLQSSRVFVVEGLGLSPLDPTTGRPRWKAQIGSPATWVGYLSDKLLTASTEQILALDPTTGAEVWRYRAGAPARLHRGPDPFSSNKSTTGAPGSAGSLHDFQLVGARLYCLRDNQELISIDGDTGTAGWSFSAGGSAINPRIWVGHERIVLQVQKPSQLLVLESENGNQVGRLQLADGESLERPPVPLDEDHVLVVPDRRTVKNLDLSRCQFTWDYRESAELPVNGPPRIIVDAERVLVLHDGKLLIRLDSVNGSKRWATTLGIENLSERPEAISCDERRVYCTSHQTLRAISIEDGGAVWDCHLTGPENSLWSIGLSERFVFAYPSQPSLSGDEIESMPLVVRSKERGALVQRFVFPATIADVNLKLDARGALVATPRALWALCGRETGQLSGKVTLP